MNRIPVCVSLALVVAGIAGCIPEKRVNWAPDGQKAAVIGGDRGLFLCDGNGVLSERLTGGVASVAWFPDSQRLAIVQSEKISAWADLTAVLTPEQRQRIVSVGDALRAELLAFAGNWDDFPAHALSEVNGAISAAALLYTRDKYAEAVSVKLGPNKWAELQDVTTEIGALHVAHVGNGKLALGRPIIRSIFRAAEPRVSPRGTAIAFLTRSAGDNDTIVLNVVPADGSASPRMVAAPVAMFADWSADGCELVFAASNQGPAAPSDKLHLGVIARRRVCDADGALLKTFGEQEDLVGILFQDESRVRCLRDGRIVFAAVEVQLPCTAADMPDRAGLFVVDPSRAPGVSRLVPRQAAALLPDVVGLFEMSPDEQRICVPGGNGDIAVLTVATGEVQTYLSADKANGLVTQPCWRSDTELCFAVHSSGAGDFARSDIVLCKVDGRGESSERRVISGNWPQGVVLEFLQKKPAVPEGNP